jgi:hypothetical protein
MRRFVGRILVLAALTAVGCATGQAQTWAITSTSLTCVLNNSPSDCANQVAGSVFQSFAYTFSATAGNCYQCNSNPSSTSLSASVTVMVLPSNCTDGETASVNFSGSYTTAGGDGVPAVVASASWELVKGSSQWSGTETVTVACDRSLSTNSGQGASNGDGCLSLQ